MTEIAYGATCEACGNPDAWMIQQVADMHGVAEGGLTLNTYTARCPTCDHHT